MPCLVQVFPVYTLLWQRRLRWLGHVSRMDDGRIPKYILYGELTLGRRTTGHPRLRYKDVCVRDMKADDIDTMSWEGLAAQRTKWRSALKQHIKTWKGKLITDPADTRARTNEDSSSMTCLQFTWTDANKFGTIWLTAPRCSGQSEWSLSLWE